MSADSTSSEPNDAGEGIDATYELLDSIASPKLADFARDGVVDASRTLIQAVEQLAPTDVAVRSRIDANGSSLAFDVSIEGVPSATVRLDARGAVDTLRFAQAVVPWTELVRSCPDANVLDLHFGYLRDEVAIDYRKAKDPLWNVRRDDGLVVVDRRAIDAEAGDKVDEIVAHWDRTGWLYSRGDAPTSLVVRSAYFGGVLVAVGIKGRALSDEFLHEATEAVTGFSTPYGQVFDPPFEQWDPLARPEGWDSTESRHWPTPPRSEFPRGRTKLASQVLASAKTELGTWATNSAAALANAAFLDACRPTRTAVGERYRALLQERGLLIEVPSAAPGASA